MARQMKDSGVEWIGEIPEGWNVVRIGSQYTERKTKVSDTEYPPLSVTMKGILPQLSTAAKTDAHDDRKLVCVGDFAINSRSDRRGSCGISAYDGSVSLINTILCPRDEMNPHYYDWLFHSTMFSDEFYKWGHGIVDDLWTTNWQDMKRISIPEPPLSEQRRIAAFLDRRCAEIDAVIERTKATIEEYKKLKQAVITAAVTKGVRGERKMKDSGIEWIGEIPEGWNRDKVNRMFEIIGSGTTPKSDDESHYVGKINWIQSGDINGGILTTCKNTISEQTLALYSALKVYHAPFIIIAMYGASVGNSSIVEISGCVNQACCVLGMCRCNLQYAFYAFKVAKEYLIQKAVGGGQPNISQDTLRSLWLPEPSADEQEEIVAYLDEKCAALDTLIARKTSLLTELETYKKSLIYEYVTGKKEVPACP